MKAIAACRRSRTLRGRLARQVFWLRKIRKSDEQTIAINRLVLALAVGVAAFFHALFGLAPAQAFFREGLPWLGLYFAAAVVILCDLALRPAPCATRQAVAIMLDAAIVSFGLHQGDADSAYLFPLYILMILGNGLRLGAWFTRAAVASAAAGFAIVVATTPFWRDHVALTFGLFVSIVSIPNYGALLLRRLAEARAEAERANHAKSLLLASVSHELRTPLTAILGLGALLQASGLDESQREMVGTIAASGSILLRHIEALLKVSREDIGRQASAPEYVDLFALLADLCAMLAVEADRKGVRLGLLIEAGTPRHILAEPGLLLDIFQNLGGNAVKFTSQGAVAIRVGVFSRGETLELRGEVSDSGMGVETLAQERIFESFVQASPEIAKHFGGSGLGLAIVRRRLEACGGRIGVESAPGEGARFWFEMAVAAVPAARLERAPVAEGPMPVAQKRGGIATEKAGALKGDSAPRVDRLPPLRPSDRAFSAAQILDPVVVAPTRTDFDAPALARRYAVAVLALSDEPAIWAQARDLARELQSARRKAARETPRNFATPGRRVLLAEDNAVNRMVLEKILTSAGHEVVLAEDGAAALQILLAESFDVALLDVNMPGLTGVEAAELYAVAMPAPMRAPMIGLTADAGAFRRRQCLAAGMVECLIKPIAPKELLAAIDRRAKKGTPDLPANNAKTNTEGEPRQASAPFGDPTLDPTALAELEKLGGQDFLRTLILQFIGEGGEIVGRLTEAVKRGDLSALMCEAHALESSAGNLGAAALALLCRSWRHMTPERLALHGDDELNALGHEWSRALRALQPWLAPQRDERRSEAA